MIDPGRIQNTAKAVDSPRGRILLPFDAAEALAILFDQADSRLDIADALQAAAPLYGADTFSFHESDFPAIVRKLPPDWGHVIAVFVDAPYGGEVPLYDAIRRRWWLTDPWHWRHRVRLAHGEPGPRMKR